MSTIIDDAIFDFAYTLAMRDATNRTAYQPKENDELSITRSQLKHLAEPKKCVREYLDAIFNKEESKKSNDLFDECEKQVEERIPGFTFGNAQKLINMTAKYMFITAYHDDAKRSLFSECHCPMDSIILEYVIRSFKEKKDDLNRIFTNHSIELDEKGYVHKDSGRVRWFTYLREPGWSRIERENGTDGPIPTQYAIFQEMVKTLSEEVRIFPLEFDYIYWG